MYECRAQHRGALLSLPYGGSHEDVIRTEVFKNCIKNNVDKWFRWSKQMDLPVDHLEDLVLVTGCTLVKSWATAVFDGQVPVESYTPRISLETIKSTGGRAQFVWRNISGNVKYQNSRFDPVRSPDYVFSRELILPSSC